MARAPSARPTHALRVEYAIRGGEIVPGKVTRVAMRAPGATAAIEADEKAGYWLEVRAADGAMLYHRALHDPLRSEVESYGDAPGEALSRAAAGAPARTFEVVIPDFPADAQLVLHGPPQAGGPGLAGALAAGAHPSSSPLNAVGLRRLRTLAAKPKKGPT